MSSSTTTGSSGAFAGGYGSTADGVFAFAFGNQVTAAGTNSLAIGRFLETATTPAMIFGTGFSPTSRLTNSTPNSLMIGFNSIKPTFFVSGAIGNGYTGKIGIGDITTPLAKLHIKGDANEDADILLMPNSNKYAAVKFGDVSGSSPNRIRALPSGDLDFFTASDFVFWDNNVGIGIYNPAEKLDVKGNIKTTGFILENGQQAANKVLLSDANGLANWVDPMSLNVDDGDWTIVGNDMYCSNNNHMVGIGTPYPAHKLDVHVSGGVYLAHFLNPTSSGYGIYVQGGYQDHPILDLNDNAGNQRMVVLGSGEVGIGTPSPQCPLHIEVSSSSPYSDAEYFKVTHDVTLGSGLTSIGQSGGNGPAIIQQAGNNNFSTGGPRLAFKQKSFNGDVGLDISTYTKTDGSVHYSAISAESSGFYLVSTENIILRTGPAKSENVYFTANGDVGIGTGSPDARLEVAGNIKATDLELSGTVSAGQLDIGTFTTDYLYVTNKLEAGEIEVKDMTKWKDEVFEEDYPLLTLNEVEKYINENGHLPDIPSESDVLENGYNVGEMDALLLQKIEELTLYVIELEKKIIKYQRDN
jgi:hypothetical protein